MMHLIFDRPKQELSVYLPNAYKYTMPASGAAWGSPGYGHDAPIAPGHYMLTGELQRFTPWLTAEGPGEIDVADLDQKRVAALIAEHKASWTGTNIVSIGGIKLPIGGLLQYGRADILIHGGGSNAPDPLALDQPLLKTYGCTRVHNGDWDRLARDVEHFSPSNTIVFSCVGDPAEVSG